MCIHLAIPFFAPPAAKSLTTAAKVHIFFLTGSFIYLNSASSFVKIPIRVIKTFLQAICSRFFPCPLSVSSKYCIMSLLRCCAVLYALCVIFFSHRFPFPKGKTMGKRSNNDRINDDATTIAQRVAEVARQCCPGWVVLLWCGVYSFHTHCVLRLSGCNGMSRIRRMHAEVHVIICKV